MDLIKQDEVIKLKRQVRDHFNKTVHDAITLLKVAEVIDYKNDKLLLTHNNVISGLLE